MLFSTSLMLTIPPCDICGYLTEKGLSHRAPNLSEHGEVNSATGRSRLNG